MNRKTESASAGDSVAIRINDQIDLNRGDMIVKTGERPKSGNEITLMACWFNERPLKTGFKYVLRHHTNETSCIINSVNYKIDINTLEKNFKAGEIGMNDIANLTIKCSKPLFYDSYRTNNITGSLIIIEEGTNETVGAGMIE
jgi:sulfate adenylyltransferase subunit 1